MSTVSRIPASAFELDTRLSVATASVEQSHARLERIAAEDRLVMKVTDCRTEREQALRLVHRVYSNSGLINETTTGIRVMKQHLSDATEIIVAKQSSEVTFTVSLVRDGEFGMPLESLFKAEVASMRARGIRLAEVSCLAHACDQVDSRVRFNTFVQGISLLLQTARRRQVDRLLLAVHPRHAKAYERLFGCVRCSEAKEYAAVRGNPAVLCMHDFASLDDIRYPLYKQIYATGYAPWQMDGSKMSDIEKDYFAQFLPTDEYVVVPMAA